MSSPTIDPLSILADRFRAAIARAFPQLPADIDPLIAPGKQPEFGDYQCNAAMPLSKRLGEKPRDVAARIVAQLDLSGVALAPTEKSIAGPGFINILLDPDALSRLLLNLGSPSLGIQPAATAQTVIVDLMGVNLAKQMHVGHLRSPVIGDAIARTFERLGHRVIRQNHVGDWGLPIAMVTARLIRTKANLDRLTLDDLDAAYKAAQAECKRDAAGLEAARKYGMGPKALAELEEQVAGATEAFNDARQTLIKLQAHEPATFAVWKRIADVTMSVCIAACKRLHVKVTEEHSAGESSYAEELAPMVQDLIARGIAEEDQGALIVRLDTPEWGGIKEPCLIRKSDGGFLYATTDICAVRRRVQKLLAERIVYVIDSRQNLHIRQFAAASKRAGYTLNPRTGADAVIEHAAFGAVLGEDGTPFKTRSGDNVNLESLIQESVDRAMAAVKSRSPELPEDDLRAAAEAIGVAAMKYADLCNDRVRDYMFSFDRMLAFEGNTGPYLLYALVRVRSISGKAQQKGVSDAWRRAPISLGTAQEKQLALTLLRYPAVVAGVADSLEPHRLCQYAYELAVAYSGFYEHCPALKEGVPESVRDSRLNLSDLTGRVLADVLEILGIPTLERM